MLDCGIYLGSSYGYFMIMLSNIHRVIGSISHIIWDCVVLINVGLCVLWMGIFSLYS